MYTAQLLTWTGQFTCLAAHSLQTWLGQLRKGGGVVSIRLRIVTVQEVSHSIHWFGGGGYASGMCTCRVLTLNRIIVKLEKYNLYNIAKQTLNSK